MLKNKRTLVIAVILFLFSMALNFPFPHEYPKGQDIFSTFNIPIKSINGLHYVGITALLFLILSLYFLTKSLEIYHKRMVVIAILLFMLLPIELVSAYQKTFATGIYAIHYDRETSSCQFGMKDETTLTATCQLPFENHSNNIVRFNIEFYEKYPFEDETPMLSLLNEGGQYNVALHGKERKTVIVETEIDLSTSGVGSVSGDAWMVNIMITEGDKVRKL